RPAAVPRRDADGYHLPGHHARPAGAEVAEARLPARPGDDHPEVPGERHAAALRLRGGAGGRPAPLPGERADLGPAGVAAAPRAPLGLAPPRRGSGAGDDRCCGAGADGGGSGAGAPRLVGCRPAPLRPLSGRLPPRLFSAGALHQGNRGGLQPAPWFPCPEQDEPGMKYLRSYQFLFDSPKWLTNLLAGTVALLVPIVGQMVLLGYVFEILEALHLHPEAIYPDFNTNRLSKYLNRGVWPFLADFVVRLVFGMLMVPVFGVVFFVLFIGLAAAGGDNKEASGVFFLVFGCFYVLLIIVVNLLLPLVVTPILLRAGITQDFGAAFSFEFLKDFVGKMWVE